MLIPKENEKDLAEIPDNVKDGLQIIPVGMVDEVLSAALVREPLPNTISGGPDDDARWSPSPNQRHQATTFGHIRKRYNIGLVKVCAFAHYLFLWPFGEIAVKDRDI